MLNPIVRAVLMVLVLACAALAVDISGSWEFAVETSQGSGNPTFEFKQDGEKLTGKYSGRFGTAPVSGTVKGDAVEFSLEVSGVDGRIHYKGKLEGASSIKGEVEIGEMGKGTFTGRKK